MIENVSIYIFTIEIEYNEAVGLSYMIAMEKLEFGINIAR